MKPPFADISFDDDRRHYLGADPGMSGGLAILDRSGGIVDVSKMPETEQDLSEYMHEFGLRIHMAVVEGVHSMPHQGVASSFKFGRGYGSLRMAIIAHKIPLETVTPQSWQTLMHCRSGGDKNKTKARAQELFPTVKVTHAIADALLLAEHCRRLFGQR